MPINVFLSAGRPSSEAQERFIAGIESYLARKGLRARTVGRDASAHSQSLQRVDNLMERCAGTLVIALEHTLLEAAFERRGLDNSHAISGSLADPWRHIEAALSYARRLPMLVIKEDCVREEGMLEGGHDWHVHSTEIDVGFVDTRAFEETFASWKKEVRRRAGWFGCRH